MLSHVLVLNRAGTLWAAAMRSSWLVLSACGSKQAVCRETQGWWLPAAPGCGWRVATEPIASCCG